MLRLVIKFKDGMHQDIIIQRQVINLHLCCKHRLLIGNIIRRLQDMRIIMDLQFFSLFLLLNQIFFPMSQCNINKFILSLVHAVKRRKLAVVVVRL